MMTNWKYLRFTVLFCFLILLFSGCNGEAVNDEPISLPEIACQMEDVSTSPPFIMSETKTAVPADTFLVDQIVNYYGVEMREPSLTNAVVFCDLFEMVDEAATIEMLSRTCTVQMDEVEPPFVGEEVCARESGGFRMVNFRQGVVVVSILADSNGGGVDEWAVAVNGRLQQQ